MHDFCFTIPYGLILMSGGLIGYLKRGSTVSLAGGGGMGLLLILAGYLSLKAFGKKKNSFFAIFLETACSITLTYVMGQRYLQTSKIMPAGVVAGMRFTFKVHLASGSVAMLLVLDVVDAVMTGFYLFKIATGGNHFPAKAE
ncbi:hypothetical protein ACFE04_006752 [Oxalis oulophora]